MSFTPALIGYESADPKTRAGAGLAHAVLRLGDDMSLCGKLLISFRSESGAMWPKRREAGFCDSCAAVVYGG